MWPFHRHEWKIIGASTGVYLFLGGDATQVRYKCSCGALKQETVNGHWTPQELGLEGS